MQLTAEQQAIVNHTEGPARVFAVAGAGKTTAMVHRIHRLVQEDRFDPGQILATSFSRASVSDIEKALGQWPHCRTVKSWTLHKLGFYVIRRARQQGYLPIDPGANRDPQQVNRDLFFRTIGEARRLNVDFKDELEDMDQEDFLAYVSRCKGNLQYADLDRSQYPCEGPHARIAQQAEPPLEQGLAWYLELYRLFEQIRSQEGAIGFDDMLMTGWELLATYPELLAEIQSLFDCVMVDEFQDVNRAQFAILDLITRPHRNYMVIGDDDQTIYEWRGASSRFILEIFDQRYHPTTYTITDNFRCPASQVVLANAVIRHNRQRYPKHLSLTQGFEGRTQVHEGDNLEDLGRKVVAQVKVALNQGIKPAEIAILVRVYAQTPYIEQFLIKEQIPYWGPDLVPFYRRSEITNFLALGNLARAEGSSGSPVGEDWNRVKSIPPLRYLNRELKQEIHQAIVEQRLPLSTMLLTTRLKVANGDTSAKLERLAHWIATATQAESAEVALRDLDRCLGYRDYLRHHSGFPETGQGKAAGVEALIDYAREKGSLVDFLDVLEQIRADQTQQQQQDHRQGIRLTTIHQAKGLEWPIVIVPHCNQGLIPFGEKQAGELEEERRLLYVAITRSKQELHLYLLKDKATSQFLDEADYERVLKQVHRLQALLTRHPSDWQALEVLDMLRAVDRFRLDRYFSHWWAGEPALKEAVATTLQQFFAALEQQELLPSLHLNQAQVELWRQLFPIVVSQPAEFPGLEALLQQQAQGSATPRLKRRQRSQLQRLPTLFRVLKAGDTVTHHKFGLGQVTKVVSDDRSDVVTVLFEQFGKKRILVTPRMCTLQLQSAPDRESV
ncbi:hypothetical protein BST81_07840 [Leptolyngbya sp. 'hensonii']|uniref:ATP-dependent helicase n=1 Tax=Leptolyngbya sp. 'hensonii' TaxID=1922337 RepID=UPI0009501014|nr:ATP-dependent helicase [Leptolyngbya sp. 'hensonii']OLP19111.1 hypothetical protein BST81_07840 [Leptolyngbya sp. 'hensonii']